jgi:uncharacterized protein YjiS (DUF1127 family)
MSTLGNLIGGIAGRYTAWRERERAFAELSALDDRTLADLGLRRGDIPYVVYCKAQDRVATTAAGTSVATVANGNNGNNGLRAA